ncbi:ABC transporter ATP-binding protein [Sulfidibacter corallicola]|uniref:ABC transporter ATP-binding protein n=1 Tax=Sulfidibacter corallicola TaxID=2818388 RepID=A0A8A4TKB5_SULCO|nr:ABC transporter ATP-binding protein [Sulfidibacter corallicola]QTD50023.1 ABC transporter ATP-binding protein [Sulfidibacter corallicola]
MMHAIETESLILPRWTPPRNSGWDIQIPKGSISGLLGVNGIGKTTLIRNLLGFQKPTSGISRLLGVPSHRLKPSDWVRIGFAGHDQPLPPRLTGMDLLTVSRNLYPHWDRTLETRVARDLGLKSHLNQKTGRLSRGSRLLTGILLAVCHQPDLLILDEPFEGVDVARREILLDLMLGSAERGTTIFFTSHAIEEVERLADHLVLLHDGQVALQDSLERIASQAHRVFVTNPDPLPTSFEIEGSLAMTQQDHLVSFFSLLDQGGSANGVEQVREILPKANIEVSPISLRDLFLALTQERRS